eukprot:scaffold2525_cov216-Amphora_coffeaeformis.AAC.1
MAREEGEELGRGKGCSGPTRCRRRRPSTSTGEAIEGGKGLGGRWAWGRVSTASMTTVSTVAYRKGSSAGVGWGNQQGYKGFEMKSQLQSEPCNTKDGDRQEMVSSKGL